MRTFIPTTPGPTTPRKLDQMRRALVQTAWQDWKLFGYRTEAVKSLQQRIVKVKREMTAAKPGEAA